MCSPNGNDGKYWFLSAVVSVSFEWAVSWGVFGASELFIGQNIREPRDTSLTSVREAKKTFVRH